MHCRMLFRAVRQPPPRKNARTSTPYVISTPPMSFRRPQGGEIFTSHPVRLNLPAERPCPVSSRFLPFGHDVTAFEMTESVGWAQGRLSLKY